MLAELKDWLSILSTGGLVVAFIMLNWLRQQFVTKEDHKKTVDKVEAVEDRVSRLQGEVEHLPDKDITHRLELAISRLDGRFELLDERLKPVTANMSRVLDHLDNRK
jgi:Protein of unknown function (DUF2730)